MRCDYVGIDSLVLGTVLQPELLQWCFYTFLFFEAISMPLIVLCFVEIMFIKVANQQQFCSDEFVLVQFDIYLMMHCKVNLLFIFLLLYFLHVVLLFTVVCSTFL